MFITAAHLRISAAVVAVVAVVIFTALVVIPLGAAALQLILTTATTPYGLAVATTGALILTVFAVATTTVAVNRH